MKTTFNGTWQQRRQERLDQIGYRQGANGNGPAPKIRRAEGPPMPRKPPIVDTVKALKGK